MTSKRWFHANLSGQDAEDLLLTRGTDGSFLCRPSSSNKNDYTLSVRRANFVTHIKIQNHGDYYDLCGGEPFKTLSELIKHYMQNGLNEKNGELIELKYPMNSKDPTTERWFHGSMSAKEAERLLLDKGKNGSYLVRESVRRPGDFALTIRSEDSFMHVMIRNNNNKFDVGGGTLFDTITDLVDYYIENPMVEKNGGTVVQLKQPLNATKITASSIGDRVAALQKDANAIVEGKDGFWEEFEQLQQQECKHLYSRKAAKENKSKNRFKNIGPFDHTRVVLFDGDQIDTLQDYINASFIDGESEHEYIATQGPLPETVLDFWRMVHQEGSCVILMVTKEVERGKCRCARYWPDVNDTIMIGKFKIDGLKETDTQEFISREMRLTNMDDPDDDPHTVSQYEFIAWPEHGTPTNVGSVLGILHDINLKQKYHQYPGPIIVHCGSGIGRTGAIIVIDILLKILQKQGLDCEIDIQKTVQHVRTQRPGMVQLEAQYKFIYLALAHYVDMEQEVREKAPQRSMPVRKRTDNILPRAPTSPPHHATQPTPKFPTRSPPSITVNGELPPPIPHRNPGLQAGLPETLIMGKPLIEEPPPPTTPPPIPARKK